MILFPENPYLYLYILLFSGILPLLWSFERRVAYYKSFTALFSGTFIVGFFFIIWDIHFTEQAYWGFNPTYLSGISAFGLPLGEYLFFIVIPFCSIFIYRTFNYYRKSPVLVKGRSHISNFLIGFSVVMAVMFYDRMYTVLTFSFLAILIFLVSKVFDSPWLGNFYASYAIILIPFLIVNGLLTGTFIQDQIVWYNDMENMDFRIFTIPFEDAFYGMVLILGIVSLYEYFGKKWKLSFAYES